MKRIDVDGKQCELHWFTGKVVSATKNLETKVQGGGGGGYTSQGTGYTPAVGISTVTTVHDQLFLVGKDGTERAFQLRDFNVACRETNLVTVLWATEAGKDQGLYMLVFNHTTQQGRFDDGNVYRLTCPPSWVAGAALVAPAMLILPISPSLGGFLLAVVATCWGLVWWERTRRKRFREFKASINTGELAAE